MRAAVLAAALLVCGGARATIDIAWMGDSITESDASDGYANDAPQKLCDILNGQSCSASGTNIRLGGSGKLYTGATYTVRNLGASGDRVTSGMIGRYCSNMVAGGDYEYFVFLAGTNDICTPNFTATDIMEDYDSMMTDAYVMQGGVVAALSVLPRGGASCWDGVDEVIREEVNAELSEWADAHPGSFFVDLEPHFDADADDVLDAAPVNLDSGDRTHPSQAGVDLLATRVACTVFAVGC